MNSNNPQQTDRALVRSRVLRAFDEVFDADEPLPADLIRRAQELYTWRNVDAELLDLLVDSARDGLALVRDDDRLQRFIAFGDDERGVHFECTQLDDGRFQLAGIVVPGAVYAMRVDRPGVDIEIATDDLGSFTLAPLDSGSIRLTIRSSEHQSLMVTPWFMLES